MNKILDELKELESRIKALESKVYDGKPSDMGEDGWDICMKNIEFIGSDEDRGSNSGSDSERKWPHNIFASPEDMPSKEEKLEFNVFGPPEFVKEYSSFRKKS